MTESTNGPAAMPSEVKQFRVVSALEGISYLVLVGIGMPLKYLAGAPEVVQIAGRVHGGLFVLFVIALVRAVIAASWPWSRAARLFALSLVPFGALLIDRDVSASSAS